jgi:short-subunit dehydrogenase
VLPPRASESDPFFAGRTIVVTGGSSGIGRQVASDACACGATVVITSHDEQRLRQTEAELRAAGLHIHAFCCDVRDARQVAGLVAYVEQTCGHLDILINNAGYAVYRPFEESTVDEILDILDVNLAGAMRCAKAFLPGMTSRRSGRIVNVASIGGELIITPNATYCAAKHGMVAWSKAIRYELEPFGVSVNVVCPGHTKTHFHDHPTFRRRDASRHPKRRSLSAAAVSAAILDGIRRDRVVTYVPRWHALVVWALNVFPFLSSPLWNRVSRRRIDQLYARIRAEPPCGDQTGT